MIDMVKIVKVNDVAEEELKKGSAKGTKVRYLIDQRHGANNFFLRIYSVEPGGQTPYDKHPYEHEVFVLKGKATLLTINDGIPEMIEVNEGDAIYIASNEVHQFINTSDEVFTMLCLKGSEHLYGQKVDNEQTSEPC